jgi:hypothetical protein
MGLRTGQSDEMEDTMRKQKLPLRVVLMSCGNPDYAQYTCVSPAQIVPCLTLLEAQKLVREYIASWNLGGGNWCARAGCVYPRDSAVCIAHISYNGRVWTNDTPDAIEIPQDELERMDKEQRKCAS